MDNSQPKREEVQESSTAAEQRAIEARDYMRQVLSKPDVAEELRTRFAPFKCVTESDMKFSVD